MPEYGDLYGEEYGGLITSIETHRADAINRLILQFKDKANIESLIGIFGDRAQNLDNIIFDLIGLRDIDRGFDFLLDDIGEVQNQPRSGFDDDDYKVFLRARATINARPFRRTIEGLLQTIRRLMNDDTRTIDFKPQYPKGYTLELEALTTIEQQTFIPFLRLTKPATYNAQVIVIPDPAFGFSDATATVATTTLGFDNASAPPNFGGPYAFALPI